MFATFWICRYFRLFKVTYLALCLLFMMVKSLDNRLKAVQNVSSKSFLVQVFRYTIFSIWRRFRLRIKNIIWILSTFTALCSPLFVVHEVLNKSSFVLIFCFWVTIICKVHSWWLLTFFLFLSKKKSADKVKTQFNSALGQINVTQIIS